MRLFQLGPLIASAVLAVLAIPCQGVRAETRVFVVYGNMRGGDEVMRGRLEERLRLFAIDVKRHRTARTLRPILQFQVRENRELDAEAGQVVEPATRRLWGILDPPPVALVWGRIEGRSNARVHNGNIYIGLAPIETSLPRRAQQDLFGPVRGTVWTREDELDAYEVIIGYALLRQVWREGRYPLTVPIAEVLKARIAGLSSAGSFGSWEECFTQIRDAATAIVGARPRPNRPRSVPSPEPVSCS